jgi:hypothetical protein
MKNQCQILTWFLRADLEYSIWGIFITALKNVTTNILKTNQGY